MQVVNNSNSQSPCLICGAIKDKCAGNDTQNCPNRRSGNIQESAYPCVKYTPPQVETKINFKGKE